MERIARHYRLITQLCSREGMIALGFTSEAADAIVLVRRSEAISGVPLTNRRT